MLPAERARRCGITPPDDAPYALVEKAGNAIRLAAVDIRALELGLAPGLPLADARARVPDLEAIEHDPGADGALLGWLAEGCDRYTPLVALDAPDGLILDITGCQHLDPRGETGLARRAVRDLARIGITAQTGLADTPDAAAALARFGG